MNERPQPQDFRVRIEQGGSDDLDSVAKVMDAAFDKRFGEAWTRSQCAGILPMPGVRLILARTAEGRPAGFSLFRIVVSDAELLLLAVAPPFRRQGVGRKLLDHFLKQARDAGAEKIHLEVRDGNPAVRMYQAAGFACVGRRPLYYRGADGSQFDALTFSTSA